MMLVAATSRAQVIFVDRLDGSLDRTGWSASTWSDYGGTYAYALSSERGMTFSKLDGGAGAQLVTAAHFRRDLGADFANGSVRYWVRYRRGTGPLGPIPLQLHRQPAVGTLTEIIIGGSGAIGTARFSTGTSAGFTRPAEQPVLTPDVWHLLQMNAFDAGSDQGSAAFFVDGERVASLDGLGWVGSSVRRMMIGFPAVTDSWVGEFDLDDILVLSERRALVCAVDPPLSAVVGVCTPFQLVFREDLDGGILAPPDISLITVAVDGGSVFADSNCSVPWPAAGQAIDAGLRLFSVLAARTDVELTCQSPDLMPGRLAIRFFQQDAGVDAGSPLADAGAVDAGSSDAGFSDAGSSDAGSSNAGRLDAGDTDGGVLIGPGHHAVGCECDAGAGAFGLFGLVMLATRRRNRLQRAHG